MRDEELYGGSCAKATKAKHPKKRKWKVDTKEEDEEEEEEESRDVTIALGT